MAAAGHTCIVQKEDERNQRNPNEPIYTLVALDAIVPIELFRQENFIPQSNTFGKLPRFSNIGRSYHMLWFHYF